MSQTSENDVNTSENPSAVDRPRWTTPELEVVTLEEVTSIADLEVAFTSTYTSGDL